MRILVDLSWLGPTGIGRVAKEVLGRCPPSWEIVPIREGQKNASIFTPVDLARKLRLADADLFWSPGFMPPLGLQKIPTVVTVHDLTHLHFYRMHHKLYYEIVIKTQIKKCHHIITVSDFTRDELISWSSLPESKVSRIYNGNGPEFSPDVPAKLLDKPYILYIGNRRSYKNVEGLLRAYAASGLREKGIVLALSGAPSEALTTLSTDLGVQGDVRYLGFIEDEDLPGYYRGAAAVAFVSRYEGFGLPILEAMACGTPVLTSAASAMPEIAGGAARLVSPDDVAQMAAGLAEVTLNDTVRSELTIKGLARAKEFSWERTTAQYWQTFDDVVGLRR